MMKKQYLIVVIVLGFVFIISFIIYISMNNIKNITQIIPYDGSSQIQSIDNRKNSTLVYEKNGNRFMNLKVTDDHFDLINQIYLKDLNRDSYKIKSATIFKGDLYLLIYNQNNEELIKFNKFNEMSLSYTALESLLKLDNKIYKIDEISTIFITEDILPYITDVEGNQIQSDSMINFERFLFDNIIVESPTKDIFGVYIKGISDIKYYQEYKTLFSHLNLEKMSNALYTIDEYNRILIFQKRKYQFPFYKIPFATYSYFYNNKLYLLVDDTSRDNKFINIFCIENSKLNKIRTIEKSKSNPTFLEYNNHLYLINNKDIKYNIIQLD